MATKKTSEAIAEFKAITEAKAQRYQDLKEMAKSMAPVSSEMASDVVGKLGRKDAE